MRYLILSLLVATVSSLSAQFGVSSYYNLNQTRTEDFTTQTGLFFADMDNGAEVAVHYWFRLKNQRIEFSPTIYYATAETVEAESNFNEYGFQFKTNIYPFDFTGDCDCPTFGKQGPALQKGLFLQLSPGYSRYSFAWQPEADRENSGGFSLGAGIGIDFGVSNFLTISPFAGLRYGFASYNEINVNDVVNAPPIIKSAKLTTIQLGLTATFRFDGKRY